MGEGSRSAWATAPSRSVLAIALGTLMGCTPGSPASSPAVTPSVEISEERNPSAPATFKGTREEHTSAMRACWTEAGFTTTDPAPGTGAGFEVDFTGRTDEEFAAQVQRCSDEVGVLDASAMPEEMVRASYETRMATHGCLAEIGHAQGVVPSWETFRDTWRAGAPWDPSADAFAAAKTVAATEEIATTCPVALDSW